MNRQLRATQEVLLGSAGARSCAKAILHSNYPIRGGAFLAGTLPNGLKGPTLDLGCGCGVIGIAAALKGGEPAYLVDSDEVQCQIADQNVRRLGIKGTAVQWNYFDKMPCLLPTEVSTIVSNPPQLPTCGIPWSVRDCGGEDGWEHIDRILNIAESCVSRYGSVYLYILGFLGVTSRTGNQLSLSERAGAAGFQVRVVGHKTRQVTRGGAVARSIKHIAKLYPSASFWVEYEQRSAEEATRALSIGREVSYSTYVVCLGRI